MSRDCLLQVTLASIRWIYHLNLCNGFDLLNSVITICTCSWSCFTQLRQINITCTILRETLFSLVLRELSQKITLRDTCQTICLILRELAWKLIQISTLEASCTRLLGLTTLPLSILTQAFTSEVIPFDTDSSFWVCNNLTTGHICNNKFYSQEKWFL